MGLAFRGRGRGSVLGVGMGVAERGTGYVIEAFHS